jgi:FKBP-type peptidyl-prolyl cis-trans isomerase (trigger factor)
MKEASDEHMNIVKTVEKSGRLTLSVIAPWVDVSSDYDDIVKEYSTVEVPGFRAGKAPRDVVEKRFQRQIMDEFSHRCGRRLGREAVSQMDTEPVGPVEIADIDCVKNKSFKFTARFDPMPKIELHEIDFFTSGNDGTDPRDMISKRLLEQVSFEVPDELIRAELGSDVTDDFNRQDMEWKAAADRVKLTLILKRIARQEGIEVDEADVARRIKEKAVEFGTTPDTLRAEFEEAGGTQRLKDMMLAESTLDFLIEKSGETMSANPEKEGL